MTFRQGLQSLVHALLNDLYDCDLRTGIAVTEFTKTTESGDSPYRVMLDNGETLEADDIFVTTPNFAAARYCEIMSMWLHWKPLIMSP